jgi:hypothetical protein
MMKAVIIVLALIAFVRAQEGKLDDASLDKLIDDTLGRNGNSDDGPPKVRHF